MQVSPKTIELTTPLVGRQQTIEVVVKNESSTSYLAFKVKTTAPKLYCVRPNCGSIAPGSSSNVAITYQGGDSEPTLGAKCKDKFLFVGVETEDEMDNKTVAAQWAQLEASANGGLQQSKVRVAYKVVEEMNSIAEDVEPVASPIKTSPLEQQKNEPIVELEPSKTNIPTKNVTSTESKATNAVAVKQSSNGQYLLLIAILVALFAAWRTL